MKFGQFCCCCFCNFVLFVDKCCTFRYTCKYNQFFPPLLLSLSLSFLSVSASPPFSFPSFPPPLSLLPLPPFPLPPSPPSPSFCSFSSPHPLSIPSPVTRPKRMLLVRPCLGSDMRCPPRKPLAGAVIWWWRLW